MEVLPPLSTMGHSVSHAWPMQLHAPMIVASVYSFDMHFLFSESCWECVQFYHGNTDRNGFVGVHPLPKRHVRISIRLLSPPDLTSFS